MADPRQVTVIGAGICGLACAYRLAQLGVSVTVLESSNLPGGMIQTSEADGFLFESGPQSFQGTLGLLQLARDLGIEAELQLSDRRAPRFIVRNKKLRELPLSPPALLASSFLSAASRWKIASEPFKRTKSPAEDESIANFARRKFGNEILEYLVAPFVSGVYAGDPEQLSLRAAFPSLEQWEREFGSVVRGAIKSRSSQKEKAAPSLCSFQRGVAALPRAFAAKLGGNIQASVTATSVAKIAGETKPAFEVKLTRANSGAIESRVSDTVILATPAYAASNLLDLLAPNLAKSLAAIPYAPVAVVATAFKRRQVSHILNGFGFLVPRKEGVRTLGTVWNSSLFPGRAPTDSVVMTSFIGGATDLEIVRHSDAEILKIVEADNASLLQILGAPIASRVWKHSRALPQYNLRHGHIVESIREGERALPGIFLTGNYLEGPALGKCVENGFKTAEAAAEYVQGRP